MPAAVRVAAGDDGGGGALLPAGRRGLLRLERWGWPTMENLHQSAAMSGSSLKCWAGPRLLVVLTTDRSGMQCGARMLACQQAVGGGRQGRRAWLQRAKLLEGGRFVKASRRALRALVNNKQQLHPARPASSCSCILMMLVLPPPSSGPKNCNSPQSAFLLTPKCKGKYAVGSLPHACSAPHMAGEGRQRGIAIRTPGGKTSHQVKNQPPPPPPSPTHPPRPRSPCWPSLLKAAHR